MSRLDLVVESEDVLVSLDRGSAQIRWSVDRLVRSLDHSQAIWQL
jgi:hypothetical protein